MDTWLVPDSLPLFLTFSRSFRPVNNYFSRNRSLLSAEVKQQQKKTMASSAVRVSCRVLCLILVLVVAFYIGRPLYWKLSATIHDIREKRQTVKEGISQFVLEAQRSVGWFHDESDSGVVEDQKRVKAGAKTTRRILGIADFKRIQ